MQGGLRNMFPSSRELILDATVSRMCLCDENTLIVYTDNKELNFIDLTNLKIKKVVPLSHDEIGEFDYYNRPIALKKHFAYVKLSTSGKEYILTTQNKIEKQVAFNYNKNQKITKAHFSEDASFLIIGNDKGRTCFLDVKESSLVYEFPYAADSVSAVAISPENKYAISASFGKKLQILNINTLVLNEEIKLSSIVEMIQFVSEDIFLAITRDGSIIKIDAKSKKIIKETKLADTVWPSEICVSHSKKFVYIGTRESSIYALHVKSLDMLFCIKLNKSGITSLIRTPKYFIVGYKTGEVQFFNHREFEENFVLFVKLKKMDEAVALFSKNIFLMSHRETRSIYDMWVEQKDTIVQLMTNGSIDEAQKMASTFMFHPKCKSEMEEIEELQPDLMALQRFMRSSHFAQAYDIVDKKPSLKATLLYVKLEDIWKKALHKAQILLSRDPILNKEKAREELYAFEKVEAKKEMIERMLKYANTFARAEMAVKNQNFGLYFKLVKENNFLELTPLYKKVLSLADKVKMNVLTHLRENDYILALQNIKILEQFSIYFDHAKKLEEFVNSLMVIEYHVNNKNLFEAIKIQNKLKIQSSYEPVRKLEGMKRSFLKGLFESIERFDLDEVYAKVRAYFEIDICKKEITMVMKHLYIAQMQKALISSKEKVDWSKTFENYAHFFRFDKLIFDIFEKLELSMSLEELEKEIEIKKPNFIKNILIYK